MDYTIIDCHAHVYPDKIASRAVESIGSFYDIPMNLDGTVGTLLRVNQAAGVSRCLVHAVAVDSAHVTSVNDFLIRTVQAYPDRIMGFASLHPDMEEPGKELERVLKAGLRGVKLHPDMQHFRLDEARTDKLYAVCEGVCPMLFHTGDARYHNSNPTLVPPILKKHPRLQLICAHFGGYSEWESAAQCLAGTGVFVDSSSSLAFLRPDRARELINLYGEDHVLFGSDYPMWNVGQEKKMLLSLGLSDRALQNIFSGNLLRLLGEG